MHWLHSTFIIILECKFYAAIRGQAGCVADEKCDGIKQKKKKKETKPQNMKKPKPIYTDNNMVFSRGKGEWRKVEEGEGE